VTTAGGLPSGRLVFFFSDVEGSTRLLTDLGDRFPALLGEHQRLVRAALEAYGGIEISTEGDSFFAVFESAPAATSAAAATQRSLAAYAWPAGHELRVRIGLHIGQAVLAGDDYVGLDVNRAARIANAANGGQVVLSEELAQAIQGQLPPDLTLLDLGRHRLKDIGVVRIWQLEIEGLPTRSSPLRSLEAHPSNLPVESTPLVDRLEETETVRRLIAEHALVTITGAGGIGKSRLAVHVARGLLPDFPDGVFHLDLAAIDGIDTAVAELADLVEARIAVGDDATASLLDHLRNRRALLVLETVDRHPGFADLAARLTARCPSTRLLVTARSPLHVRAGVELSIRPLDVPPAHGGLEAASSSAAVELFVRRATAVNPGFRLTASNVDAVSGIVGRLDGLPLAIELAASGTRLLSPAALLDRLERSLPLPGGAPVDVPERQRTLHATIAWSYQDLEPRERVLLQRLSAFSGAFGLDDFRAVAGIDADPAASDDVEPLGRLVDRSLIHRLDDGDDDRYRLLGPIRDFAASELAASGDADVVRLRLAYHWLDAAARDAAALDGPGGMEALASLDRAADDYRAALRWTLEAAPDDHLALRLSSALGRPWYLRGRVHEGADWLDRALRSDAQAPPGIRAEALHWLGVMLDELRNEERAIECLEEGLAIQRAIGDARMIARELNSLGVVHRNTGDLAAAEALLAESLQRRRTLGDQTGIAAALTNLGIVAIDRKAFGQAIKLLEEALEIDRRSGATGGAAYSSSALGTALLGIGRRTDALDLLLAALAGFHDLRDADGVAESLERLAEAAAQDEPARAARLLLASGAIRDRENLALRGIDESRAAALMATVTGALTDAELGRARADAEAMDLDAAVAYALAPAQG
jgi:predicted ATPase/class 3 adenylate cyclase